MAFLGHSQGSKEAPPGLVLGPRFALKAKWAVEAQLSSGLPRKFHPRPLSSHEMNKGGLQQPDSDKAPHHIPMVAVVQSSSVSNSL